jgi:hypothetical protein
MTIKTTMMTLPGKSEKALSKSSMPSLLAAKGSWQITGCNLPTFSQEDSSKETITSNLIFLKPSRTW